MRTGRPPAAWDGHLLVLASGAEDAWPSLAAWVSRGLELGEKVVCVVAHADRFRLVERLRASGVDAAPAAADGRLEVVPALVFDLAGGPEPAVGNALGQGYPGVRLALPPRTSRRRGVPEEILGDLCRNGRVSALCRYELATTHGARLGELVDTHVDGVRSGSLVTRRAGGALALAGEVDISNLELFSASLRAVTRAGDPVAWLDLGDLRFMDVAACRALARATERFRVAGGELLLVDPLPPVAHVLTLLGVGALPGVELVTR